ncbi:hypothetical protein BDV26DRAFT_280664 [Aspergillus bertholletiae]|uniref:Uncharacterized protein n=1 Tax=Aspergillus bertholletiae TaxID=1226010 RepID=A0A5N7BBC6_9EURO|nr:hypothetical protein BDV26DRAFT_280664 [Aspergillus bertholletiae]
MYKLYTILAASLLPSLSQAFSLDTVTSHWNYTTANLVSTTSQKCKDAYSADIACDPFLVQLVNADEKRYFLDDMEKDNFTQTCTTSCHSSITKYIANVKAACSERGDAAVSSLGFVGRDGTKDAPVQTVGRIFEYTLMRSCSKDEDGQNCYITQSGVLPPDFECNWTCALAFYWNKHFYPYSDWTMGDSGYQRYDSDGFEVKVSNILLNPGQKKDIMGDESWETLRECGYRDPNAPPFDTGLSGKVEEDDSEPSSSPSNSSSATTTRAGTPAVTSAAGRSFGVSCGGFAVTVATVLYTSLYI